jgi:uncharacterized delta-60 repeat protein
MAPNKFEGLLRKILACGFTVCAVWAPAAFADRFYSVVSLALPDGRRLIGGGLSSPSVNPPPYWAYSFAVERVYPDGTPDVSFNGNGFVTAPILGYYEFVDAFAAQPDGKVIVGGNAADPVGWADFPSCYPAFCKYYPALVRLNADGSVDRSFNGGKGKLIIAIGSANSGPGDVGEFGTLTGVVMEPDGKIVIYDGTTATARANANGTLDTSFVGTSQVAREFPSVAIVVEYYNTSLDHYFMTWVPDEIDKLDEGGVIKGWARTGFILKANTSMQAGTSPVCRFYIPPALGDSHFFGRGTEECNATAQRNPSFVLEDSNFMQMLLPAAGVCPTDTTPVYRVFSNRHDANHRYMTDKAVRDEMLAKGWVAEGDGSDAVVMCAPQ